MYNALVVAPFNHTEPLSTIQEITDISDIEELAIDFLVGESVTRSKVETRLKRQHYDVVILVGHGLPGRFLIRDGALTSLWLARYLRLASPTVVLISACDTLGRSASTMRSFAEDISDAGISVVTMASDIDDKAAMVYDVEFLRALTVGATLREAHAIALEQMEAVCHGSGLIPHLTIGVPRNGMIELANRLTLVEEHMASLEGGLESVKSDVNTCYQVLSSFRQSRDAVVGEAL